MTNTYEYEIYTDDVFGNRFYDPALDPYNTLAYAQYDLSVIGFPGYVIDTNSAIYSTRGNSARVGTGAKNNNKFNPVPVELIPFITKCGYEVYTLWNSDAQRKTVTAHRTLALAAIPIPCIEEHPGGPIIPWNKLVVDHKDGDKLNNHISNLHWVTQIFNIRKYKVDRPVRWRIADNLVHVICRMLAGGVPIPQVAVLTGLPVDAFITIAQGRAKRHISRLYFNCDKERNIVPVVAV